VSYLRLGFPTRASRTLLQSSSPTGPDARSGGGTEEYSAWHLALTVGAKDETKARYAFIYGDFRRVHRTDLIACVYRATEWRHKEVELAAHEMLQLLDRAAGIE
jgi:hypothetical protein